MDLDQESYESLKRSMAFERFHRDFIMHRKGKMLEKLEALYAAWESDPSVETLLAYAKTASEAEKRWGKRGGAYPILEQHFNENPKDLNLTALEIMKKLPGQDLDESTINQHRVLYKKMMEMKQLIKALREHGNPMEQQKALPKTLAAAKEPRD
tara:strand:- start:1 stop:462 length:462 start_codon:yes stop_codon:yes gene_type:complete